MLALTSERKTLYHRLPVGLKLAVLTGAVFGIYASPVFMICTTVCVVVLYASGGRSFALQGMKSLRPLTFFVATIVIWHIILKAPLTGLMLSARMVTAVALANFVTMTSRLDDMLDFMIWLAYPLKYLGISTKPFAYAVAMIVRFIPVFTDRAVRLKDAWRARSLRPSNFRLAVPLALSMLNDADSVAEALHARGGISQNYHTENNKGYYK